MFVIVLEDLGKIVIVIFFFFIFQARKPRYAVAGIVFRNLAFSLSNSIVVFDIQQPAVLYKVQRLFEW